MLKGFKTFLLRGNVVDLAVAVVIGAAFGAVVAALVKDLLTPLIAAIVGQPDFSAIVFTVNGSKFLIGDFINAVLGVCAGCGGDLLLCRHADEHDRGAAPTRRGTARSHHEEMLGMSERGTCCGPAVRLLYAAPAHIGRSAIGASASGDHMNIGHLTISSGGETWV